MSKILSLIIPSYNMEKYLPQCLESLLVERIDDLDIIVVNDGSKDSTLEIALQYASKYPDSFKVINKPNGNYGSCINSALREISGKYIKVLDADDSFEKSKLDGYLDFLKSIDVDLVVSNYVIVDERGEITEEVRFAQNSNKETNDFQNVLNRLSQEKFTMHAVTYNSRIFKNLEYRQSEGLSYTDMEWMFLPMTKVNTAAFYGDTIYRYLVGRVGQTVDVSVSQKAVNQTMAVVSNLLNIYDRQKTKVTKVHKKYLELKLTQKIPSIYRIYLIKIGDSSNYPQLLEFDGQLKRTFPEYYDEVGKENLIFIPFRFVTYWRNHNNGDKKLPLLQICNKLYKFLSSIS